MKQNANEKRYDTREKRIQFLKRKGSIITFKSPFYPRGTANGSRIQIIVVRINEQRAGGIKIVGEFYDSDWYDSLDALLNAIDWDEMEVMHSF